MSGSRPRRQHFVRDIAASPAAVYAALLDPGLIGQWRVPDGMRATVHEFEGRPGGRFRVTLTYDQADGRGKTSTDADTYHGVFGTLVPGARVEESLRFETEAPEMQGTMTIVTTLHATPSGTRLEAVHEGLPVGVSADDNQVGWREALDRLARLLAPAAR